jgi:hypothetical protein
MAKKSLLVLIVLGIASFAAVLSACASTDVGMEEKDAYTGNWDYIPNPHLDYVGNRSEKQFQESAARLGTDSDSRPISKVPPEVIQAMSKELDSYGVSVGDCFLFFCGYEEQAPKAIVIFLRITAVNSDGKYRYVFYPRQHI